MLWCGSHVVVLVCCVWAPKLWCWCALVGRPCVIVGVLWFGPHLVVLVLFGVAPMWCCWCALVGHPCGGVGVL